ncbi:MAG: hypothetical protein C4523_17525 [Myxococcales bacterium]|nr:MAG: hypothetical protein C4523_17525 [Myxococcales bacterium]
MKKLNVLLIGDDKGMKDVLDREFRFADRAGCQASDTVEWKEIVRSHPIDLMVSSIKLDGLGLLSQLAPLSDRFPNAKIRLLSGEASREMLEERLKENPEDLFITSVSDLDELIDAMFIASSKANSGVEWFVV